MKYVTLSPLVPFVSAFCHRLGSFTGTINVCRCLSHHLSIKSKVLHLVFFIHIFFSPNKISPNFVQFLAGSTCLRFLYVLRFSKKNMKKVRSSHNDNKSWRWNQSCAFRICVVLLVIAELFPFRNLPQINTEIVDVVEFRHTKFGTNCFFCSCLLQKQEVEKFKSRNPPVVKVFRVSLW